MPSNTAFDWFGGKAMACRRIVPLLPPHTHYAEPFAGSAAILFAKPRVFMEALNDLDGDIVNFFTVLRDEPESLLSIIELTPFSREELFLAYEPAQDSLERARRFAVRCQQGAHSKSGSKKSGTWRSMLKNRGTSFSRDWSAYANRLPRFAERLLGVAIDNRGWEDCLSRYDSEATLFYVDPPYMHETRVTKDAYAHEMSGFDHARLLDALRSVKGMVVLSGYRHPTYDAALSDWDAVEFEAKTTHGKIRTEVIWRNRAAKVAWLHAEIARLNGS